MQLDNSKQKFNDFVDAFNEQVQSSRDAFLSGEAESEKVLLSKLAKNIDFREKIEERLKTRIEKHESSVLKSKETHEEKEIKIKENYNHKLEQLLLSKEKDLLSIESNLEKEKEKHEKELDSLDKQYVRDEKKCMSTIEKEWKKADAYSVENNVNRTEKDAQSKFKNIQNALSKSLSSTTSFTGEVKNLIDQLKNTHADIELAETESKSRFIKLKQRVEKEELVYNANVTKLHQTTQREIIKSQYDLDKVISNYEYNITHENLKTEERKRDLEHKISLDQEEYKHYEEKQMLKKDRDIQLETEHLNLETIIQKDRSDNVKNNFALSNKEHKNLQIYMKAVHDNTKEAITTNYKLALEEVDLRSKHLQERVKIAMNDLKVTLDHLLQKVKTNLKTELKMPNEHIKLVESKHKLDAKELSKMYESKIKQLQDKLVFLDQTFDQEEIKEIKASIVDLENRHQVESSQLERDFNKILQAYQTKITYATERSERIQLEAQNQYDKQVHLYNQELERIKQQTDNEKEQLKSLFDASTLLNKNHLDFSQKMNELATKQNDDLMTDLVELAQSNIDTTQAHAENRNQKTTQRVEARIKAKNEWLKNSELQHQKELKLLESKLAQYKKTIETKISKEKRDVERHIVQLQYKLKRSLASLNRDYKKISHSFEKAMKDAELKYDKSNKKLLNQQALLITQLEALATESNIEVVKEDYDIFFVPKREKVKDAE